MANRKAAQTPLCRRAIAARDGDATALAELLRELQDVIWRFCLAQLADRDAAEDATQETAARLIAAIGGFQNRSSVKTWALGVALNVCRERRRKKLDAAPPELMEIHDDAPDASERIDADEQAKTLKSLIATLPPRQREAVVLRYFEQLTLDQTAEAMGCTAGAVKASLWQALRRLRGKLNQPEEAPRG